MLYVLEGLTAFESLKSQMADIKSHCLSISRQLYGWIEQLKNSDITGQRHLNDTVRTRTAAQKDRDTFLEELDRIRQCGPKQSDI